MARQIRDPIPHPSPKATRGLREVIALAHADIVSDEGRWPDGCEEHDALEYLSKLAAWAERYEAKRVAFFAAAPKAQEPS